MLGRKGLLFGTALLLLAIGGDLASAADSKKPDSVEKNKETAEEIVIPEAYTTWLEELKQDMINKGIKPDTVETVFEPNYYHPKPEVVKIDRRQIEFVLTSTDYLNKVINKSILWLFGEWKQTMDETLVILTLLKPWCR